jgi:hypothetical protein
VKPSRWMISVLLLLHTRNELFAVVVACAWVRACCII